MTATLIVTVDTEEEGLWGGTYRRTGNTVENVRQIPRFQEMCDRFGIRPTYLVDAPVVQSDEAVSILGPIQDDGRCEIGTHVHPWCNPPFEQEVTARNSYLCNLPEPLQRAKIEWLTETIQERFGRRPTSFRAGRYGLDIHGARILEELGYTVDSSVIPFSNFSKDGGPNFTRAPSSPYFIDTNGTETGGADLLQPNKSGEPGPSARGLLELPVTVGYNRTDFERCWSIQQSLRKSSFRRLRIEGILDRLGLVRRIKLSPEQADAEQMKRLIDTSLARHRNRGRSNASPEQGTALVLMFHSSSLLPGCTPYVTSQHDLKRFYGRLEAVFDDCLVNRQIRTETLTNYSRSVNSLETDRSVKREACLVHNGEAT